MKKAFQLLSFLSFGLFVFYLVYLNQNKAYQFQCASTGIASDNCNLIDKLIADFGTLDPVWLFMIIAAFSMSNVLRAKRWQMQFEAMGHTVQFKNTFWSIHLGYFANLGIPRLGEILRAGAIQKYDNVPLEKSIGSLVIDRMADLVCLALFIAVAFLVEFDTLYDFIFSKRPIDRNSINSDNSWPSNLQYVIGLLFGAILLSFIFFRKKLKNTSAYQFIISKLEGFWNGIISIKNLDKPFIFILLSIGIWMFYYLQCVFAMWSFPPTAQIRLQAILMVFISGSLGFLVPTPGSMGSSHALTIAALTLYNINGSDAFTFSNISFLLSTFLFNVIMGILALFILPKINKS